ncbi:NAD-dependent epimerase/dehydratase family protein [Allohahella marinimesophila]|uniref:SDR family oxidoreductase n=1 Tax=Allohahella marinimesophila TaxID=1054972 RepID=A0ABP7NWD3_9GAMM
MRVLITGANGFIGRSVVNACLEAGHEVVATVRTTSARHSFSDESAEYPDLLTVLVLPDLAGIAEQFAEGALAGIWVVIHCAGAAHATKSDPAFYQVNAEGVDAFAALCAAHGVQRFILLSTIKVFPSDCLAIDRYTLTGPDTEYGRSKRAGEVALLRHCSQSEMACSILRFPLVYGADFKGNLGLLKIAARMGLPLPLGGVSNRKSLIHLPTLVSLIEACLESHTKEEILLVADPQPYSTEALYRYICSQLGVECRTFSQDALAGKLARKIADRFGFEDKLFGDLEVDITGVEYPAHWRPGKGVLEILTNGQ